MKIGLVGASYQQRSLPFDAQRTINLFPIMDETGKETSALYSVPGKSLFATAGIGAVRGGFTSTNERAFVVSGAILYEVFSDGTTTSRGAFDTSSGNVTIAENLTQLAICDTQYLYIFTYSTNTFAKVTDADFPSSVGTVTSLDGYFIVNKNNTGRFYHSALNDGTSWDALNFATAESSSDNLLSVKSALGQLWLFGTKTVEIWTNTGDSNFRFRRISGAKIETGLIAAHVPLEIDNSIIWVGNDSYGQGIVYRAQGFSPVRISTTPIEKRIQEATDHNNMRSFAYQEEGNTFYVLTGGGLETSLVYDLTTQQWHERAYLNAEGNFEQDLASCHFFAFGKHLVGDRINGNIYELSLNYYTDGGGEALARERVYTHLSDEGRLTRFNSLEIGFETGVGLQSGQGTNPLVSLALSKDGARTWIDCGTTSIGMVGQYGKKVIFRRLGVAEQMTFKIRITEPVKVAIIGSYLL